MLAKFIFESILGWKVVGGIGADIKKAVIIVYPHTSWHDFYIGALARNLLKIEINYVAKQELFDSPFGWYFRWMGGAPIDRKKSKNTVEQIVDIFNEREEFRLAITPEGTRKRVDHWKTGFYHIAKQAKVSLIPIAFDYSKKEVQVKQPITIPDNILDCFVDIRNCFGEVVGKHPSQTSPIA